MGAILAAGIGVVVFLVAVAVLLIVCMWKIFSKAGQPGIAAIVPIWSNYVLTCGVAKKEILWFILQFIPFINIIAIIIVLAAVCKKFGYSGGFVVGIILLPIIFLPILAFGGVYEDDSKPKRRSRNDYEDEDEDDRPRRRSRRDDD